MHLFKLLAIMLITFTAISPALGDGDHPDIKIELNGSELEIHGHGILHSHDYFRFVDVGGGNWFTSHGGTTWPGFGADNGTFPANSKLDLILTGGLYYWDAVSPDGFLPATGSAYLSIKASAFSPEYFVYGSSTEQTLGSFITVNASGGIHMHPIWQLFGNGTPADGAYYLEISVDGTNYMQSEPVGIMFHKGLTHEQYELALALMGDDHHHDVIPEPSGIMLLAVAASGVLLRRRV